ncbi:uncharacterized protein LOC135166398 isoform X2 [Diachasmimorpha longicaudata]|uniref:uncharacterized protein LOC135166398 isoform X2 n=1 Tax=Diachasmimorpha longicaudata TaxID=58733 RepID=UPI0030B87B2F
MMMEIGEAAAAEVQPNLSEIEQLVTVTANRDALARGILQAYQPSLEQIKKELDELLKKQDNLIGKMQFENKQLTETAEDGQCCAMREFRGQEVTLKFACSIILFENFTRTLGAYSDVLECFFLQ